MPSSGLSTASPCSATKAFSAAASRLTSVGGQHCGNSQRGQLLVQVAQALRVVDHQRAGALRQAQDLGVVEVVGVDRRVLAHQHHVAARPAQSVTAGPVRGSRPGRRAPRSGATRAWAAPSRTRQAARQHVKQAMAAPLRLQQHRERGVLGDLDRPDRVHHDDDVAATCGHPRQIATHGSRALRSGLRDDAMRAGSGRPLNGNLTVPARGLGYRQSAAMPAVTKHRATGSKT